jgi:hypothetical protein
VIHWFQSGSVASIRTTGQLVKLHGKPAALLFTAGPARAPKIYADATALVKSFGIDVCPHIIADRAAFRHAGAAGQTVFEFEPDSRPRSGFVQVRASCRAAGSTALPFRVTQPHLGAPISVPLSPPKFPLPM